jgi:hypothetical protein
MGLIMDNATNLGNKKQNVGMLCIFFAVFLQCLPLFCQKQMEEYQLKVLIVSRFFDFVTWPPDSMNNSDRFVIGIIGDTPILDHRQKFYERVKLPGRTIAIQKITDLDHVVDCQALIIAESESDRLNDIIALIERKPILSISDSEGFGEKGVLINLYRLGKNVKFEINYSAVKRSGLVFSSKLYKLARIIKRDSHENPQD